MGKHMGVSVLLHGPQTHRAKAVAILRQQGWTVDESEEGHGFEPLPEHTFITAHGRHVDAIGPLVEHLDFVPKMHWHKTGDWQKLGDPVTTTDKELAEVKAELARITTHLRANGIVLPDSV